MDEDTTNQRVDDPRNRNNQSLKDDSTADSSARSARQCNDDHQEWNNDVLERVCQDRPAAQTLSWTDQEVLNNGRHCDHHERT